MNASTDEPLRMLKFRFQSRFLVDAGISPSRKHTTPIANAPVTSPGLMKKEVVKLLDKHQHDGIMLF